MTKMRLKKCVLSFLRKLVRDEISFMSDGSAFQARATARRWKGLCQPGLLGAEYVKCRGCYAHWTEAVTAPDEF